MICFPVFQVCVSSTRSYEDEEEEEESRTPSGIALPPYPRSQRHLTIIPPQNSSSLLRKELTENREIIRELDYSAERATRFPGISAPHLPVGAGQTVEKDDFNKIIPESKKGPQVREYSKILFDNQ